MPKIQVPVRLRSLLIRLQRRLAKRGEKMFKSRGNAERMKCGDWYVADEARGAVVRHHVEVEALAREVGALRAWEVVEVGV